MRRNLGALILEDIVCMNMDKLKERMGDEEFDAGRALYRRGAVRENQRSADFLIPMGAWSAPAKNPPFAAIPWPP